MEGVGQPDSRRSSVILLPAGTIAAAGLHFPWQCYAEPSLTREPQLQLVQGDVLSLTTNSNAMLLSLQG